MATGEIEIRNNTSVRKSLKKLDNQTFKQNVVFINSNLINENINELLNDDDFNTLIFTDEYERDNIDFLNDYDLKRVRAINILSEHIKNIDGIYSLNHLEDISSYNQKIDYVKFPNLRCISGELSTFSYKTLSSVDTLESIMITNKFKEQDVSIFSKNHKLKFLMLGGSKITSLNGLQNFKKLEYLELFYNRRITSLEGLTEVHNKNIKKISIYSAPKLFYVNDYLSKIPNVKHLQLDCKKVDSFKFLENLNNLKLLSIHNKITEVEDGDKIPLLDALKRTNSKIW